MKHDQLMIHVERIVRPLRATESRKLRMRRELLSHLKNAFDEEIAGGADASTALVKAKERLGNPTELTQQLQQAVPTLERIMLRDMPLLSRLDRKTTSHRLDPEQLKGVDALNRGPAVHALLLTGAACVLPVITSYVLPILIHASAAVDRVPAYQRPLFAAAYLASCLVTWPCCGFAFALAKLTPPPHHRRVVLNTVGALAMQLLATTLSIYASVGHLPSAWQLGITISTTMFLLMLIALTTRWFVKLRQPYEEWLLLKIVE